ncbi:NAD-dependent epimerase [Mucilaginibacter litoreus]|uniref:NAD-dependent epimerase n=1 Tax=Mucilaginibacter litoreus TaxID=1048221 RepID=A0ABW3AWT2_9SPHI
MKILITGTAGFVGYHLTERLILDGHQIVGIDSINDYYDVGLKFGRLEASGIPADQIEYNKEVKSEKHNNYRFVKLLLEDEDAINDLFKKESFDVVVNLAAQAGVRYSLENPHAYVKSNVSGFLNILEASRKYKVGHLVYASSSSVYGLNKKEVFSTDDPVDHPVSLYAATKRSNELMAHVYSHLYQLPVTGLRFFTVYGPWGRPDMAPMLFTKAILDGKPISVFNHGDMRRDFTYVSDIVEGIVCVIPKLPKDQANNFEVNPLPSNSSAPFAIYNIGNNSPVQLMDFISILEDELGIPAVKQYLPMQAGDVYSTYADVSPLINEVGYKPKTSLKEGIGEFVKWYKEFYIK